MVLIALALSSSLSVVELPEPYKRVIARVDQPLGVVCAGVVYEGNNLDMRGPLGADEVFARTGDESFAAWKTLAEASAGVFVLRDSLISQQDHPYRQRAARAPLLPPNWITAAATNGAALKPPVVLPVDDDAAWAQVRDASVLVGGFPKSDALFEAATRAKTDARTLPARATVLALGKLAAPLLAAVPQGPAKVMAEGARVIVEGDAAYFGAALRAAKVIPIFVENPRRIELEEGKGSETAPDAALPDALRRELVKTVYGARLAAGALAVERYDLSDAAQRARAISVAKAAIEGAGSTTHPLWLWVTGRLNNKGEVRGEDAVAYIPVFRREMAAAGLDTTRVRLLSKPVRSAPKGADAKAWLKGELKTFEGLALPLSTTYTCTQLQALAR